MAAATVDTLCKNARQAFAQGKIEQAKHCYLQALGQKPDSPDAHYGLATAYFLLNDLDSAAYHFKEVTRLDPLRPAAYVNLGAVLNKLHEYEDAIQALRQGIKLDPQRAEGHYNLGLIYKAVGRLDEAVAAYLEAARLNPNMVDAHHNLANLYLEVGQFDLAAREYRTVLQLKPGSDRDLIGLQTAEQALAELREQEIEKAKTSRTINPQRRLDPDKHGVQLEALYLAVKESESRSRKFLHTLESEIEPAIKELSSALIGRQPGSTPADLDDRIKRFESAVKGVRDAHERLKTSIEQVHKLGERLVKS